MFRRCLINTAVFLAIDIAACASPYAAEDGAAADGGEDGAGPDGGTDSRADAVASPPPGCDAAKSLKDSPLCIDDSFGVFVAPSGNDAGRGTKMTPVRSLARALDLAFATGLPRVYVCEGSYAAAAEIRSPISVYGGLTCGWSYSGKKPTLAPPTGVALRINGVTGAVVVEDFAIEGSAELGGTGSSGGDGGSAIALFASLSPNVTLRNVDLRARDGASGAKGASSSNYSLDPKKGGIALGAASGLGPKCTCADGTSSTGGSGAAGNGSGLTGGSSVPPVGIANDGSSGASTCVVGGDGAGGLPGGPALLKASYGILSATGWDSSAKPAMSPSGHPGQGGGGGGAKTNPLAAGGGGGCGGCGGGSGGGGSSGGSSFALLSFNSKIVGVGSSVFVSGRAGAGGAGGNGQSGQPGAGGGFGVCIGGAGGAGAGGGAGNGGTGGHSAAVGYVGMAPQLAGMSLSSGTAGTGGAAGMPGADGSVAGGLGSGGLPGPDGKASPTLGL